MRKHMAIAFCAWVALAATSMTPASGQTLLERLQDRVRERLGTGDDAADAPQPTAPPTLQAPPTAQTPRAATAPQRIAGRDEPATPRLGLEAEEQGQGFPFQIFVNGVRPGSPAAEAGVLPGDVIVQVDGREVGSIEGIAEVLRAKRPGDTVRIRARRGDRPIDLLAKLSGSRDPQGADRPDPRIDAPERAVVERPPVGSGWMGVTVENVQTATPGPGVPVRRGAVVVAVTPGSPAAAAGIRPGNVIVAIDGRVIRDAAGLIDEMGATVPGQEVEMSFYRGESLLRIPVRLAGEDDRLQQSAQQPAISGAQLGTPSVGSAGAPTPPPTAGPADRASEEAAGAGGAAAGGPAAGGADGLLNGFGQAIGGIFGGAAAPSSDGMPADNAELPDVATPEATTPEAGIPEAAFSLPSDAPVDASQPPPTTEPADAVLPADAGIPGDAGPPADAGVPNGAEAVPLPAGGPDEILQLLRKIEAMQRRIDVLERRLAELEATVPQD